MVKRPSINLLTNVLSKKVYFYSPFPVREYQYSRGIPIIPSSPGKTYFLISHHLKKKKNYTEKKKRTEDVTDPAQATF